MDDRTRSIMLGLLALEIAHSWRVHDVRKVTGDDLEWADPFPHCELTHAVLDLAGYPADTWNDDKGEGFCRDPVIGIYFDAMEDAELSPLQAAEKFLSTAEKWMAEGFEEDCQGEAE